MFEGAPEDEGAGSFAPSILLTKNQQMCKMADAAEEGLVFLNVAVSLQQVIQLLNLLLTRQRQFFYLRSNFHETWEIYSKQDSKTLLLQNFF